MDYESKDKKSAEHRHDKNISQQYRRRCRVKGDKLLKRFAIFPKGSETPCTSFLPIDALVYYMLGVLNSESTIKKIKNG